jgi:ATP-dependent helicase/nuclease subunit A
MSNDRKLEPAQARAAYTLDRHISVTAGPGAGKTTVLVERYLHILGEKKPSSIDQIVAITFTNRAANEMRERLRKALDTLLATETGPERARWMRYKRTLDGAVITTIHGLCMRLLREFPVEAGLDPQFMLLDEHRASTLLASSVEESLSEFIGKRDEAVSRLTAGIGRPLLATALWEMYLKVRGQGLSFDRILEQTATSHAATEDYDAWMNDLIFARGLTPVANEKRGEAERTWPKIREMLRTDDIPLADYCGTIVEFREAARPNASGRIGPTIKRIDELFWGENKEKSFGRLPQMKFDLLARDYAIALVRLLQNIDRRFTEKKQELSALDFDDLQLRTIELLRRPEVLQRAYQRYKYFLVDEFQDTNGLQRDLLNALALQTGARANLFIVGDRKQSVYGFRGADVDVFARTTEAMLGAGGESVRLSLNFRSQPQLINFFNYLFAKFFHSGDIVDKAELSELGFVEHEPSEARREACDRPPLVELMVDTLSAEDDPKAKQDPRERDARQIVKRIIELTSQASVEPIRGSGAPAASFEYRDIALLFRAMTNVPVYEAEFRRAGIPFQTVLGKGFYEREEITDLIQLCRFLDNRTDELALAAVLRSPLCGISDNTLLALRLGPRVGETPPGSAPQPRRHARPLFRALRTQAEIDFIDDDERNALKKAYELLSALFERRNRYPIGDLLRYAVDASSFTTVIAATYDGAQRLANIEKLFGLAERFERSGAHLIRDFVKYVHDFEAIGSRESEGQLDDSANAVKLMTIHQAKGLEFPVVIIPDLHRSKPTWEGYFLLDRHRGLTLKVPNGRGQMVSGRTFTIFSERSQWRENFESMRLLYVAATRAQDRLILSGATKDVSKLANGSDTWLQLIWQALDLGLRSQTGVIDLAEDTQLLTTFNITEETEPVLDAHRDTDNATINLATEFSEVFPLLRPLEAERNSAVHRFSVTQLINYRRCPRQYYFDRVLHVPTADQLAVWNDAEAPEPPANLTATLKGAVIHRFCETYAKTGDAEQVLRQSFAEVVRKRQADLADRLVEINEEAAIAELMPLAQNYLSSELFERIELARTLSVNQKEQKPDGGVGLWSELSFRLRRPLGILTGAIDKLLITPSGNGDGVNVEIIDFKTNRFREPRKAAPPPAPPISGIKDKANQIAFDFESASLAESATSPLAIERQMSIAQQVQVVASDYQLQMQAYALAVSELMPSSGEIANRVKVILHFLEPDIEFRLPDTLLSSGVCAEAIDNAMTEIVTSLEPHEFPVRPAMHCRMCNFLRICPAGRDWVSSSSTAHQAVEQRVRTVSKAR